MQFTTSRTGLVNATGWNKNTALVYINLDTLLMQCLTLASIAEKPSSRTSPMTSSDMTIRRRWRSESESREFLPHVNHLWFFKHVHFPCHFFLLRKFLHLLKRHHLCPTSVTCFRVWLVLSPVFPQTVCPGGAGRCQGLPERGGRTDRCEGAKRPKTILVLFLLSVDKVASFLSYFLCCYAAGFWCHQHHQRETGTNPGLCKGQRLQGG